MSHLTLSPLITVLSATIPVRYRITGRTVLLYLFDLSMILKRPVKVALRCFNQYVHSLLHILVTDIQTFLKHYKLMSFVLSTVEEETLKFTNLNGRCKTLARSSVWNTFLYRHKYESA